MICLTNLPTQILAKQPIVQSYVKHAESHTSILRVDALVLSTVTSDLTTTNKTVILGLRHSAQEA